MSGLDVWGRGLSSLCIRDVEVSFDLTTGYCEILLLNALFPLREEPSDRQHNNFPTAQKRRDIVINTGEIAVCIGCIDLLFKELRCNSQFDNLIRIPKLLVFQQVKALCNSTF